MSVITPTTPNNTQVIPPVVVMNGNVGTRYTLDLTTKRGAWAYGRIGRRNATALTRSGYIAIRATQNNTLSLPNTRYDMVSNIAAGVSTTLFSGASVNDAFYTVSSATSLAAGDTCCIASDDSNANRVEFLKTFNISGTTVYPDTPVRVAHNLNDRVTTMADVFDFWLPGGDVYEIRAVNNSGQDLIFALDVTVDPGDTVT